MNQAAMFDREGKVLRDIGMQQAVDHAEQVEPGWKDLAYRYLQRFLNEYVPRLGLQSFMAEDIRAWAHEQGLGRPPTARAWGGIIAKAANRGLIVKIGVQQVKNKTAHCANANLWRKAA